MMLMCGQSNGLWHYLAGKYPGKVGMILGPSDFARIKFWMPYALDNDAFQSYSRNQEWSESAWFKMLEYAAMTRIDPLWVLVPDKVADKEGTLARWEKYAPVAKEYGWPLAFAVQDGMETEDVPDGVAIVFVGGSTDWKWRTLPVWASHFARVHVGRVNELRRLWTCEDHGVESVDGSGWFRATDQGKPARRIIQWIEGNRQETMQLL